MSNHLQYMRVVYDSQAMYTTVQQIRIVIHTTCMNLEGTVLSERTWHYQKVTAEDYTYIISKNDKAVGMENIPVVSRNYY